ncbi:MAG: response regulator [Gammaproteobacteria bacterium]|nr:response regulator [Gammaproteobacteria bacterium]
MDQERKPIYILSMTVNSTQPINYGTFGESARPSPRPTILAVDDNPPELALMTYLLHEQGYQVLNSISGLEALRIVEEYQPDLILMDVEMPLMGGVEACQKLKENPELSDIPVILIIPAAVIELRQQAFSSGAADYIPKPFFPEEVIARVKTHLTLQQLRHRLQQLKPSKV